jgi:oligopeptide/dipeptide ABC transporter ATP-binding protein
MTTSSTGGEARPDVLRVVGLRTRYITPQGAVKAVDGVSFNLRAQERFGLAGESGSGKSSMALSLMRMIKPPGKIVAGEVWLEGRDLLTVPDNQMPQLRLAEIALVAQGSMNSLNPVMRVRDQIADAFQDHGVQLTSRAMDVRVGELLVRVGLRPEVARMYPHELSGGMKQRVCIAIAIALTPKVIIADEPTSALDVVVQRQVMETLRKIQEDIGASVILVGHDMGLMAQFVDRLGVMYAGKLVELSPVREIFARPRHPYTALLIASLTSVEKKGEFRGIPGMTPSLLELPTGCAFHPRCPHAAERCRVEEPAFREVAPDTWAACHLLLRGHDDSAD